MTQSRSPLDQWCAQHRMPRPQVYKQKLKHVLSEHQSTTCGLKKDAAAERSLIQNQNAEAELRLQNEMHDLQADFREKKHHDQIVISELKLVSLGLRLLHTAAVVPEVSLCLMCWFSTETPDGAHGIGKRLRHQDQR